MFPHRHDVTDPASGLDTLEPVPSKKEYIYNGDGTLQQIKLFRNAAGTILSVQDIYSYTPGPNPPAGLVSTIQRRFYDSAGVSVVASFTKTYTYDASGILQSTVNQ